MSHPGAPAPRQWTLGGSIAGNNGHRDAKNAWDLVPRGSGQSSGDGGDFGDPVASARRWLAEPTRRDALEPTLVDGIEEALRVADTHMHEIGRLASHVALDLVDGGVVDQHTVDRLDLMADALRDFSERLRSVVEEGRHDPDTAVARVTRGLGAARSGGGFMALVSALGAPSVPMSA